MRLLDKIDTAGDVRKLNLKDLEILAYEIRRLLVRSISKTGGHLASNLGVVELTLAIHYCFDIPNDKIIWDVGHQSYVHKILTGRKNQLNTLRQLGGLSGFPKPSESECDCFATGHSSTSISAALGFAVSRDLKGEDYSVISIIGDGSMTGGLTFEAINNAGRSEASLIVILNDNEMSISKNVGALSRHLNNLRTAPSYIIAKKDINRFLKRIPIIGKRVSRVIERVKDGIKYFFISGVLFEELGFKYIGPVDGHNIRDLIYVLNSAKKLEGPTLIHVFTKKGKGYIHAENHPEHFHGVNNFNIKSGRSKNLGTANNYTEIFGNTIVELAKTNKKIVTITASMPIGTGLSRFRKMFPKRFFDVGIAEAHAVTFSAGMAKNGMIPVFAVYSSFLQRGYDQIVHDVCLQNLHVVLAIDHAGIVGPDGETHQGVFDLSYLSHIPNMTVMAPRDGNELREMIKFAVNEMDSPVAIRYPKGADASNILPGYPIDSQIKMGEPEIIFDHEKSSIAILSVGAMTENCYKACLRLKETGIEVTLINPRFIKPIDIRLIERLVRYEYVFIIEDNLRSGGYGTCVLEKMSDLGISANIKLIAVPDEFIRHGSRAELLKLYGMDSDGIFNTIFKTLMIHGFADNIVPVNE